MKTGKEIYSTLDLRRIGLWATIWWGVSCGYLLLWVWLARNYYVLFSTSALHRSTYDAWKSALSIEHNHSTVLMVLRLLILFGWVIGFVLWFRALKKNKISYKVALKDLFLTIRK
jgi:hypothetical protein